MTYDQVQILLQKAHCPKCKSEKSLSAYLRCDVSDKSCDILIRCENCVTQFTLDSAAEGRLTERSTISCDLKTQSCKVSEARKEA